MSLPRDVRADVGKHPDASRVDTAQTLAAGLLQAAVRGGATRQVAAAVAATLLRAAYELADGSNSKTATGPAEGTLSAGLLLWRGCAACSGGCCCAWGVREGLPDLAGFSGCGLLCCVVN